MWGMRPPGRRCDAMRGELLTGDRQLLEDLWHRGWGHVTAAKILAQYSKAEGQAKQVADPDHYTFNGPQSPSLHLLIGYGMELLLKVAVLLHGGREGDTKAAGHDLVKALDRAEDLGFRCSTPQVRFVAENLREMHLNHRFRYGGADQVTMPSLPISLSVLDALVIQLGEAIYGCPFGEMALEINDGGDPDD